MAFVSGIGAVLWCFKGIQLTELYFSKLSSESLVGGSYSTVLLNPVSMVLNVMPFMHSATINSDDQRVPHEGTKADGKSNVVVMMFRNVVLWTVFWCFGRHADTFRGGGTKKKCHPAAVINLSSTKANPSVTSY